MSNKGISPGSSGLSLLILGLFAPLGAATANNPCDPALMTQAVQACGLDITCINQANSDFMARCLGGQQPAQPPAPSGPGIREGDVQQQVDACGKDLACLSRIMQQLQAGAPAAPVPPGPAPSPSPGGGDFELPDPEDTTRRLREQTVLPASWLQTHQDTLVSCGEDNACWSREVPRRRVQRGAHRGRNRVAAPLAPGDPSAGPGRARTTPWRSFRTTARALGRTGSGAPGARVHPRGEREPGAGDSRSLAGGARVQGAGRGPGAGGSRRRRVPHDLAARHPTAGLRDSGRELRAQAHAP